MQCVDRCDDLCEVITPSTNAKLLPVTFLIYFTYLCSQCKASTWGHFLDASSSAIWISNCLIALSSFLVFVLRNR